MYGRNFFPTLRLGDGVLNRDIKRNRKGLNRHAAYAEAELFIQNKLSQGYHPEIIDAEICAEIMSNEGSDYKTMFLKYARRIIDNLRGSDLFGGIPSRGEYEKISIVRDQRARYEMMMYERFSGPEIISQYVMDDEFVREIGAAENLDPRQENTLREMREEEHRRIEEQYQANEEALRTELADANFRAESAEQQLHFQNAQFALRPRQAGTTKHGLTRAPDSIFPETRAYGASKYDPSEGGPTRTSDRDDMRSQRSYRPGFDDRGMPVFPRDFLNRPQPGVEPGYRYVEGTRSNRDRPVRHDPCFNGPDQGPAYTTPEARHSDSPRQNRDRPAPPNRYPDHPKHRTHSTRRQPSAHGGPMPPSTRGPPTDSSQYGPNSDTRSKIGSFFRGLGRTHDERSTVRGPRDDESFRGGKCWTLPTDTETKSSSSRDSRDDRSTIQDSRDAKSSLGGGKCWTLHTETDTRSSSPVHSKAQNDRSTVRGSEDHESSRDGTERSRHRRRKSTHPKTSSSSAPRDFGWVRDDPSEI